MPSKECIGCAQIGCNHYGEFRKGGCFISPPECHCCDECANPTCLMVGHEMTIPCNDFISQFELHQKPADTKRLAPATQASREALLKGSGAFTARVAGRWSFQ